MKQNLNNKKIFDFTTQKIIDMINEIYALEANTEEFNSKINQLKIFYFSLVDNKIILEDNKFTLYKVFDYTSIEYIKNWILDFLTSSVLKLYKNEVNQKLLINNSYFAFRLLANKEILKDYLYKFNIISQIHFEKIIPNFTEEEVNQHVNDLNNIIKLIKNEFNIDYNSYVQNTLISYADLKNSILHNNKNILIMAEKNFFEIKNDNLVFSDFFVIFIDFMFIMKLKDDYSLNLNYNTYEEIRNEIANAFI